MKLSDLTTAQIRSGTCFGVAGTPYIDGTLLDSVPDGLHKIRGVFPVDVTNAVRYDDSDAWNCLMTHAFIHTESDVKAADSLSQDAINKAAEEARSLNL